MSKHSNFNSTDHTIQPADNVEREVNGVQEKREEKKEESVIVAPPVEEKKDDKEVNVVVKAQPKDVLKKVEEKKNDEQIAVGGYKPDLSKKSHNPVEISSRADYMRKVHSIKSK